jgi:hypothetical protein
MARYLAKANLYVDRFIGAGEEFAADIVPGRNWEPLDAAAKKAFAERFPTGAPQDVQPAGTGHSMMAIPEDWREMNSQALIQLAVKLGAPRKGTGRAQAEQHIEREIIMRAHSSDERTRDAA